MAWWNPATWVRTNGSQSDLAAGSSPDLTDFERANWTWSGMTSADVLALASYGMGCRPETPPQAVPMDVIDAMGWHPVIYAGESLLTAPATDPELYYLRGPDTADGRRVVAECEAWLRPLLTIQRAPLLSQITRAVAYGAVPIILDYQVAPLSFEQDADNTKGKITRTILGHAHYVRSHEINPAEVQLRVMHDRLLGVIYAGQEYGGEDLDDPGRARAFLAIWDQQFGRWIGHASRRRAYRDWIEEGMARLWEIRYTERSVDLPRVGYAPEGTIKINGQDVPATKLLRAQIMSMRNGSAMVLPSTIGADNQPAWKVEFPSVPPRHEGFAYAISSRGARMLLATLCPSDLNKANEEAFMDGVQRVCDFAARTLTRMVRAVLRVRYGERAPFVQVLANDIPKRKLRTLTQVFGAVSSATHHMPDGRVYTLAELVHPEILDQLGVRALTVDEAAHEPAAPEATAEIVGAPRAGGRPLEPAGEREERRDNARTIEGEYDTGGDDVEREARA